MTALQAVIEKKDQVTKIKRQSFLFDNEHLNTAFQQALKESIVCIRNAKKELREFESHIRELQSDLKERI